MRIKFSIQHDYWYFYIVGWGKTGPAHSFPPPKSFDHFIDQLVFRFMLLFHYTKVRIKFSIQQDYWYFYIVGWGKTGPAHSFPPSKIFCSFYWSVSLSVYVTLSLYLNTYEWPIPKRESSFQTKHFICLLHCWVGKDWAGPFSPPPHP